MCSGSCRAGCRVRFLVACPAERLSVVHGDSLSVSFLCCLMAGAILRCTVEVSSLPVFLCCVMAEAIILGGWGRRRPQ